MTAYNIDYGLEITWFFFFLFFHLFYILEYELY